MHHYYMGTINICTTNDGIMLIMSKGKNKMRRKIQKMRHSLFVNLPVEIVEDFQLKAGQRVDFRHTEKEIIVTLAPLPVKE